MQLFDVLFDVLFGQLCNSTNFSIFLGPWKHVKPLQVCNVGCRPALGPDGWPCCLLYRTADGDKGVLTFWYILWCPGELKWPQTLICLCNKTVLLISVDEKFSSTSAVLLRVVEPHQRTSERSSDSIIFCFDDCFGYALFLLWKNKNPESYASDMSFGCHLPYFLWRLGPWIEWQTSACSGNLGART